MFKLFGKISNLEIPIFRWKGQLFLLNLWTAFLYSFMGVVFIGIFYIKDSRFWLVFFFVLIPLLVLANYSGRKK